MPGGGDAVWERAGGLGANFSVSISETAVLPCLNSTRKKESLGCSHGIRPAMGVSTYLRLFEGAFIMNAHSGRETKLSLLETSLWLYIEGNPGSGCPLHNRER